MVGTQHGWKEHDKYPSSIVEVESGSLQELLAAFQMQPFSTSMNLAAYQYEHPLKIPL